ncbi:hypothetical protein WOLCODRAFT_19721 [Wolfiporia cocos MD-104 SS10]|uniref:Uncharacterized protein n=1 Tax=Wolfiporia cocos (strain MD-104) TaxID=742152 RepID=A0A2H3JG86_WOLCO|nr:hypothetical protein WOLCODRAFT_19721 [Wolfiporia cocos MD-104 SS10]
MHYPGTPSSMSSRSSSSAGCPPNAPIISPKALPSSPLPTAAHLPGRNMPPPPAPYMRTVELPTPPAVPAPNCTHHHFFSHQTDRSSPANLRADGLLTPPSTPVKAAGLGAPVALHPLLAAPPQLRLRLTDALEHAQFSSAYSARSLREAAATPVSACIVVKIMHGIFTAVARPPPGRALAVEDVLAAVLAELWRAPLPRELSRFPPDVQVAASMRSGGDLRCVDLFGPRTHFAGLQVTHVADGITYCELLLA